jgi:hypothetical protein
MDPKEVTKKLNLYHKEDDISLKELIQKLKELYQYFWIFRSWIVLFGLTGGLIGFVYAQFFREVQYSSKLTFAIEEKSAAGGSLVGLASQFGVDLGGGATGGLFSSDNLLILLKSNRIIQGALLKPVVELEEGNLLNLYLSIHHKDALSENKFSFIPNDLPRLDFSREQDSIVDFISKKLSKELEIVKLDKKASLIDITIVDPSEKFALLFNQFLIQEATDLYIEFKVGKMRRSVKILQSRVDSVQRVLDGTMHSAAAAMDQSLGIVNMAPKVMTTKKQLQTQILGTLFGELTKNLELTRYTLEREEPIIQIIDRPIMPLLKIGKGRILFTVIGALITGSLILGFFYVKRFLDRM